MHLIWYCVTVLFLIHNNIIMQSMLGYWCMYNNIFSLRVCYLVY